MTQPTREEAMLMAREAGCPEGYIINAFRGGGMKWIEALVALAYERGVEDEREECANLCDARYMGDNNREDMEAKACAASIRNRSK